LTYHVSIKHIKTARKTLPVKPFHGVFKCIVVIYQTHHYKKKATTIYTHTFKCVKIHILEIKPDKT